MFDITILIRSYLNLQLLDLLFTTKIFLLQHLYNLVLLSYNFGKIFNNEFYFFNLILKLMI